MKNNSQAKVLILSETKIKDLYNNDIVHINNSFERDFFIVRTKRTLFHYHKVVELIPLNKEYTKRVYRNDELEDSVYVVNKYIRRTDEKNLE